MKNKDKGFSLVELLIAIAVSSIVLSAVVLLIAQSVRTYGRQTAMAQIQSDADITLNQISKNIMESTNIYLVKKSDNVTFYTTKDSSGKKVGYYYDAADKTLYYATEDAVNKSEKNNMSVVCEYVNSFSVMLDTSNFTLKDNTTIEKLPENYKFNVKIEIERMGEKRTVERSYTTRNKVQETKAGVENSFQIKNIGVWMWNHAKGSADELKVTQKLSDYSSDTVLLNSGVKEESKKPLTEAGGE